MEKTKNNMKEKDILGFDPEQLKIFDENEESNKELLEAENMLKEKHIKNCCQNKSFQFKYKPSRVYLAGKINKKDWREPIVGYRCNDLYGGDKVDISNYTVKYNNIIITGPWFLACDHGCYHGDNSHGLGVCQLGCGEANGDNYSEKEVYDICLSQIDHSDIVFAYIYDNSCFGTIYEISYAISKGKYVVVVFSDEKLMSDMWFMCQGAHYVDTLGKNKIEDKLNEIINKLQ